MERARFSRIPKTRMKLGGFLADYVSGVVDQWLLVAPKANPAMLEMYRDRDTDRLHGLVAWAGEFAGKYLTSAVQVLRIREDALLRGWLKEFVAEMIGLQAEDGYLGPWPKVHRLTNSKPGGGDTWDTWSHYHVMLGLMLWHEETGDKAALASAAKIADLLCSNYLGNREVRLVDTRSTEMNLAPIHSLCRLYRKLGTKRYLELALQIADEFGAQGPDGPLAGDYIRQALDGKQFFETPKPRWESLHPIMGIVELYWITGEERYKEAFERLWRSIARYDRHNNGGFSTGEGAVGNPYAYGAIETCCTIAWMAMSVEMLKLTGDSLIADELELSTLNQIVGTHSATGRWATYDTPMDGVRCASAHSIVFQAREGSPELNCCSVNSPRGFGLISEWALMTDKDAVVLNWYGESTIAAKVRPGVSLTLVQKTGYPISGGVTISVNPSATADFAIKLRIPRWSTNTSVNVNGQFVDGVEPGNYLEIRREWKKGDEIQVDLDMSLHFWRGERECEGKISIYRGPLLLAFDKRYNLDFAPLSEETAQEETDPIRKLNSLLVVPALSPTHLCEQPAEWTEWLPPLMLLEFEAADGRKLRLCDFGSAGEAGTPYVTWLPIEDACTDNLKSFWDGDL